MLELNRRYLTRKISYPNITEFTILEFSPDNRFVKFKVWGEYEEIWKEAGDIIILADLGLVKDEEEENIVDKLEQELKSGKSRIWSVLEEHFGIHKN